MTKDHRFWDRMAKRYHRQPIADPASYETKLKVTQDYLAPDMRVLEFGCGTGGTAIAHAPYVKAIDAIDVSPKMIAIARNQATANSIDNVNFAVCDFADYAAPEGSYNAILGLSILHLVEDRDAAIAKVYRLLKPGGVFVSSTTCLGDHMGIFKLLGPIGSGLGLLPTLKVFTTAELESSLTSAGFNLVHHWRPDEKKAVFIIGQKDDG